MAKKNGFFIEKDMKVDIMEDLMMKDGQKHILLQDGLVMQILQLIMLMMIQNINIVQLNECWERTGGETTEQWNYPREDWVCQHCKYSSKTFTDFLFKINI